MAKLDKIDSNVTGLRFVEEASYKVLPGSPVWLPLEPNSYADFGGQVTLVARNPINPGRQRKKGAITDLDDSGGFNTDLTQTNLQEILQGFFFADLRTKSEFDENTVTNVVTATDEFELTAAALSAAVAAGGSSYVVDDVLTLSGGTFGSAATFTVTEVTGGSVDAVEMTTPGDYTVVPADPVTTTGGSGTGCTLNVLWDTEGQFDAGDLIWAKDFDDFANNGLHTVTGTPDENTVGVTTNLVDDASPVGTISRVGYTFTAGDLDVDASGTLPKLTASTKDLTELGLIPGEWIFVGGDAAGEKFTNAVNNGFKRVKSVSATEIEIDKSDSTMVTEASTTETVQLFIGRVLKNETGTLIKRRTYQLERTLGVPETSTPTLEQSEYLVGAVPGEFSLQVNTADKLMADLSFVGADVEPYDETEGLKAGTRPSLTEADAFNTSSDFTRIKLAQVDETDEAPTALFAFVRELNLVVNNTLTPEKAIGVLGSFEVTAGSFAVSGSLTAYFADVAAQKAVRNNEDITIDAVIVKANAGLAIDVPMIALGDARVNIEQDAAITIPLTMEAATGAKYDTNMDHTLLICFYDYLPNAAE
jgi:hypothetical protein